GERVNRAQGRRSERRDDRPDVPFRKSLFERDEIDRAVAVSRDGRERDPKDVAHARVGVMRLDRGDDRLAGSQEARDPERLEIRDRPAAREMSEVRRPTEHRRELGNRLLLHERAGATTVERMIVRIDEEAEGVREARGRMRWL